MGGGTLPAGLTARLERIAALTSCFSDPLALSERGEHSLEGEGERDEEKTTNRQIDTHRRGRGERERERERRFVDYYHACAPAKLKYSQNQLCIEHCIPLP